MKKQQYKPLQSNLADYKSLLDWAINAWRLPDEAPTQQSKKRDFLDAVNAHLGTNYSEPHLNNWIAGRKPIPGRVWKFIAYEMIDSEVGFDHPCLAAEIIRLLGLK